MFVMRRGQPGITTGDNGSSFKGAYNELHPYIRKVWQLHIRKFLLDLEIGSTFGTPKASEWNDSTGSKSSVYNFARLAVNGRNILTFLAEVEGILNGLPIVPVTEDSNEGEPLTVNKKELPRSILSKSDQTEFLNRAILCGEGLKCQSILRCERCASGRKPAEA